MKTAPTPIACSGSTLGLLFRQVRVAMWAQMERELAAAGHELTFSQYITLKKLADGTAGVTDLARAAELNPGAMTRLLDRLEARGLVARVADPSDRRALNIHLTDSGVTIANEPLPMSVECKNKQKMHREQVRTECANPNTDTDSTTC